MPANVQITAALTFPTPLPPDQDCPPSSLNAIFEAIEANAVIVASDAENPQGQTDSTAELALNAANNALQQVAALQGQIPERRSSGTNLIPLPAAGDSDIPLTWAPALANTNYELLVTFFGPADAVNTPAASIHNDSRQVSSCMVRITNRPAGTWSMAFSVTAL